MPIVFIVEALGINVKRVFKLSPFIGLLFYFALYPAQQPIREYPASHLQVATRPLIQPLQVQQQSRFAAFRTALAGACSALVAFVKGVQQVEYVCTKHKLTVPIAVGNKTAISTEIDRACKTLHSHLPQTIEQAKRAAELVYARQYNVAIETVKYQDGYFTPFLSIPEAYMVPIETSEQEAVLRLVGDEVKTHEAATVSESMSQLSSGFDVTFNTEFQKLEAAARTSIEVRSIELLSEAVLPILTGIDANTRHLAESVESQMRGYSLQALQTSLSNHAYECVKAGDVAGALNATGVSMCIDLAIAEVGPDMYTRQAELILNKVIEFRQHVALIQATGLARCAPEVADLATLGPNKEFLPFARVVPDRFNFGPRTRAAIRGVEKGTIHFTAGVQETVLHPVETTEKIIRAADKIANAIGHFILNDIHLKFMRNGLEKCELHGKFAMWQKHLLKDLLVRLKENEQLPTIADAYAAVANLTPEQIQTVFSHALIHLSSEDGIERAFQLGTEVGLGLLTGKALGSAVGAVGESLGGAAAFFEEAAMAPRLAADGTVAFAAAADGGALVNSAAEAARQVAAVAEMGTPATQLFAKMGSEQPQRGSQLKPPSNSQAIEQRVERLARESEVNYQKTTLQNQHRMKQVKAVQVSAQKLRTELAKELQIVQRAEVEFAGVEGLEKTIESFERAAITGDFPNACGASYELETALKIAQEEPVIGLGLHGKAGTASREMDIITQTRYIECKNIDWNRLSPGKVADMKGIFGTQSSIARRNGISFEVHSKQPISESFKAWFKKNSIRYFEG